MNMEGPEPFFICIGDLPAQAWFWDCPESYCYEIAWYIAHWSIHTVDIPNKVQARPYPFQASADYFDKDGD